MLESKILKIIDFANISKNTLCQAILLASAFLFVDTGISSGTAQTLSEKILGMEQRLEQEFEDYFGEDLAEVNLDPSEIAIILTEIGEKTGTRPAVLWAIPRKDELHLVLITPGGKPIVKDWNGKSLKLISKTQVTYIAEQFTLELENNNAQNYLKPAQILYDWIIGPIDDVLEEEAIDTLLVCLGAGLRIVPLAALHDGEKFLIEKYSIARIPAFNLIELEVNETEYEAALAMGISQFNQLPPLPAVPIELEHIHRLTGQPGKEIFLNDALTLEGLNTELSGNAFDIVHLATHAAFKPGKPEQSFIQLWDSKLHLDELDTIPWKEASPLDLLILSACQTTVGDEESELGFSGVALKAGVKSVLASLWSVSDVGTLALMSEFYKQLPEANSKAEALRQTQIQMLRGNIRLKNGKIEFGDNTEIKLTESMSDLELDLSQPSYWAGFTLVSSPW